MLSSTTLDLSSRFVPILFLHRGHSFLLTFGYMVFVIEYLLESDLLFYTISAEEMQTMLDEHWLSCNIQTKRTLQTLYDTRNVWNRITGKLDIL